MGHGHGHGRIQEPIIGFLKKNYSVHYVDAITEPGPCKILAEGGDKTLIDSIINRVKISVHKNHSKLIFISGHHDCAGNPVDEKIQREQVTKSIALLKKVYPDIPVIGLWIDREWRVNPI